jgi:ribonucleotide reductase alpha subunit
MALLIEPLFALIETEYTDREIVLDPATGATAIRRCPVLWSDTACTILFSKYARRAGVPGCPDGETDAAQIFNRLAQAWTVWGVKQGHLTATTDNAKVFRSECEAMLAQQVMAPNSPQWFNTGLELKYGIRGPAQGHWAIDELDSAPVSRVMQCEDAYTNPQISACFIQSVTDSLVGEGGIMDLFVREARLFKYGGGSGSNYSAIRGKGEPLAGGGTSSGLLSFLKVGDTSAGAIKSGGTTRRAAKMVTVDIDHPDIESFITWKASEERKIRALQAAGYSGGMEGEAATSAQGQNANNSVRVTDAFMDAVRDDAPWNLTRRTDGAVTRVVRARDLWEQIAQAAWSCADPGLQFHTTINDWHTCPADGEQRATNPCQPAFAPVLTPDGISTIGAIEIGSTIWTGSQWAQVKRKIATGIKPVQVYHTTAGRVICTAEHKVFQDGERVQAQHARTIDWCPMPGEEPCGTSHNIERVEELGEMPVWDIEVDAPEHSYWTGGHRVSNCSEFSWLNDTACNLASINLVRFLTSDGTFDFERFRAAVRLCTIMLDVSVSMAGYPTKRIAEGSRDTRTLGLGYANLGGLLMRMGIPYDSARGRDLCSEITSVMGARSWLTSAEISAELGAFPRFAANREHLLAVLEKHAVAADDAHIPKKRWGEWMDAIVAVHKHGARNAQTTLLAPTGTIGLVMDCDTTGIEPAWSLVAHKSLAGGGSLVIPCAAAQAWLDLDKDRRETIFIEPDGSILTYYAGAEGEHAREVFKCANDLSAEAHLGMMAAAQPFLCGAISKTVNLPESATVADVAATYLRAHELGLKAIALYRDKCKATEVYSSGPAATGEPSLVASEPTPPQAADALEWGERRRPERGTDGSMGAGPSAVVRVAGDDWYLHTHTWTDGEPCEIFLTSNRQGSAVAGWSQVTAILASLALQYGCPVSELVDKLRYQRFDPADFRSTSPVDAVAQALARLFGELPEKRATPISTPIHAHSKALWITPTGETCSTCGSADMRRSGACFVCGVCGTTSGCS